MTFSTSRAGQSLHLTPPEGVPITFRVASLRARMGAQALDLLVTYLGTLLVTLLLVYLGAMSGEALESFAALVTLFLRFPYYFLSELIWNGRTLGKRMVGLRVISADGLRLTPYQLAARNLMKEVEVFLPIAAIASALVGQDFLTSGVLVVWVIGILIVPLRSRGHQRLGDMVAGTVVVDRSKPMLLPDLAQAPLREVRFRFRPEHLDIYGRMELQVLEQILRSPPKTRTARDNVAQVAATIRKRIAYDETVSPAQDFDFLSEFYREQREYLESRSLFGDKRADKFHARPKP